VILILANAGDPRGPLLRDEWADADARLLTPHDLHRPGWAHEPARPCEGTAVAEGKAIRAAEIDGVCTLMPAVFETDLAAIRTVDRAYVAAEMTAFLCAWLSALPCPVVNAPGPACLSGPHWGTERWLHLAAEGGIPTLSAQLPLCPQFHLPADVPTIAVTVVGSEAFGTRSPVACDVARRLTTLADVPLLRVHVTTHDSMPAVAGADLSIETGRPGVGAAILELLVG
jgi:hypothetical protein